MSGQTNGDGGAELWRGVKFQFTTEAADDSFGKRQAKAGTLVSFGGVEGIATLAESFLGHALTYR